MCFAHITPGGQSERLTHRLTAWHVPFSTLGKGCHTAQAIAVMLAKRGIPRRRKAEG